MPSVPRKITVLIDSREKQPLLFPETIRFHLDRTIVSHHVEVATRVVPMPHGDYCLEGHDDCCVIERKGSARELWNNLLTADFDRFARAVAHLTNGCRYPYLLLDMPPSELSRITTHVPDPGRLQDCLFQMVQRLGLRLLYAGHCKPPRPRRHLGEQMIRLMLAHLHTMELGFVSWSKKDRAWMWKTCPDWGKDKGEEDGT